MPSNSFVGAKVVADDPDFDELLEFSIVAGNNINMFAIEACSGQIRVLKSGLDYEAGSSGAAVHVLELKQRVYGKSFVKRLHLLD